jgi:hypothetical protein
VKKVPVQAGQPREKKERKKRKSKSISGRSIPWRRPPYGSCGRKKQKTAKKYGVMDLSMPVTPSFCIPRE